MGTRVGAFELIAPLGRGGMGEVWHARHVDERVEAAVKLLHPELNTPEFRAAFDAEIRLVAGLAHPRIGAVLDAGEVDDAPWFAMQLFAGGDLGRLRGRLDWATLRGILRDVVDALAHAHARGVLHLDLKPQNVLRDTPGRAHLTDFGIGRRMDGALPQTVSAGTPRYMAPEQFERTPRDLGPWTDLYALGCLAWVLATGRPVYDGPTPILIRQHRAGLLPQFAPVGDIPTALGDWLECLLAVDPRDRFRRAADARAALDALRGGRIVPEPPPMPAVPSLREPAPVHVPGGGLALFGVRALPVVGRKTQRLALWESLRTAEATGRPQVVLLEGPSGMGKSRLARWIAEEAEEAGAAQAIRVLPQTGLAFALSTTLGCQGLTWEERRARLRGSVAAEEAGALAAVTGPDGAEDLTKRERQNAVLRQLVRMAADRPVVLWLDDAALDEGCLALLERVANDAGLLPLPALIVATAAWDDLLERPDEARRWAALPGVQRIELGALPPTEHQQLIRDLIGLRGEFALQLQECTAGHPLFAVELIRGLIADGLLSPTPHGFRPTTRTVLTLPDDLFTVWRRRSDAVLRGRAAGDRAALEIAAVLGAEVPLAEWRAACWLADALPAADLSRRLADQRLVVLDADRLRFAHGQFRAAVLREARESGRWPAHNTACADMVAARPGADPARLGRHLAAAGRHGEAIQPLLDGHLQARLVRSDHAEALALVESAIVCLDATDAPADDPRRIDAAIATTRMLLHAGRAKEAAAHIEGVIATARQHGRPSAGCELMRANVASTLGDLDSASHWLAAAWAHVDPETERDVAVSIRIEQGQQCYLQARYAEAFQALEEADRLFDGRCRPSRRGAIWYGLATCHIQRGDPERALASLLTSRAAYLEAGSAAGIDMCDNVAAYALRQLGRLDEAIAAWTGLLARAERVPARDHLAVHLNLAMTLLLIGRVAEAQAALEPAREDIARAERGLHGAAVHALGAWAAALRSQWNDAEADLELADRLFAPQRLGDPETSEILEHLAEVASRGGRDGLAARAGRLAAERWQLALQPERAAALAARYGG